MTEKPDWMAPQGEPWVSHDTRVVYDNPWLAFTEHNATAPTGAPALYAKVGFKNLAIGILPLYDDGTIVMVGQHRFPCADYSWEIPEGGHPLGGDPLDGARRELAEETGLKAAEWREVLVFQTSNSITDERGRGYIAFGLSPTDEHAPDDTEVFQMKRLPFAQALELALAGHIEDLITLAMLLRAHHMAVTGQLPDALSRAMLAKPVEDPSR